MNPSELRHALRLVLSAGSILAMSAGSAQAGDGALDPGWMNGGRETLDVGNGDDVANALIVQRDGRLLLAGTCMPDNLVVPCAVRLRADGTLDDGFGDAGKLLIDALPGSDITAAAAAADGGSYLGGQLNLDSALVVRLTAAGELAQPVAWQAFQFGDFVSPTPWSEIRAVAVQADGKVMVAGFGRHSVELDGDMDFGVARFLPDLSALDPAFNNGHTLLINFDLEQGQGESDDIGDALAIQPDGRIVLAGTASSDNGYDVALARLTADGQFDASFGDGGRVHYPWCASGSVVLQIDRHGRLLIGGNESSDPAFCANRLLADGSQDPSFGPGAGGPPGPVTVSFGEGSGGDELRAIALQGDGRILLGGYATLGDGDFRYAVARLESSGPLDSTFGSQGLSQGYFAAANPDSKIAAMCADNGGLMIAGSADFPSASVRFGLARLAIDSILSEGFDPASLDPASPDR